MENVETKTYHGAKEDLWKVLQSLPGLFHGISLSDVVPKRWTRSGWEYVALLLGQDKEKSFSREFICKSGSTKDHKRGAKGGSLIWLYPLEDLAVGSIVEIRVSVPRSVERYQKIYRLDPLGWYYLAYRQCDVSGWDKFTKSYRFRRFYPWELVVG